MGFAGWSYLNGGYKVGLVGVGLVGLVYLMEFAC